MPNDIPLRDTGRYSGASLRVQTYSRPTEQSEVSFLASEKVDKKLLDQRFVNVV